MNQVPEQKKDSVTKTLAILGFVAIIILIVWLAVKVVALIPGAFSSLASIADSVYNRTTDAELVVTTENSVINDGESFTITWNELPGSGTYSFGYKCTDGVSIDIRLSNSVIEPIVCNTLVNLADNTEVEVVINTEKQRFTDVEYVVAYNQEGVEPITTTSIITVVNATIPTTAVAVTPVDESTAPEANTPTAAPAPAAPTGGGAVTTKPPAPVAGTPRIVKHYIWQIPESDPKGTIDLQVSHVAIGVMERGIFYSQPELEEDEPGVLQFEIKNIGSKTADRWSYEVELPDGETYESGNQKALKPNERVVLTLSFAGLDEGKEEYSVDVTARGDINNKNNDLERTIRIVD